MLCRLLPERPVLAAEPPPIWQMIGDDRIAAYNVPSGILFDMHREAAAKRPGVLTKVGLDTFVDPRRQGCAMNAAARPSRSSQGRVRRRGMAVISRRSCPTSRSSAPPPPTSAATSPTSTRAPISAPLDQALAARNNGGIVIAQVKRVVKAGTLKPQRRAGARACWSIVIVVAPDQLQTTQTRLRSRDQRRDLPRRCQLPADAELGVEKVIARRVAMELRDGWAVNLGFGISANVPRILLEEGRHGDVTWVIEQGAVGGVPLLDFEFGCSANAEAIMPSPQQFTYFQGGGFDCSLLSFLQIDRDGNVNVSRLAAKPHVTAGCGGFVDITARAKKIVFTGYFTAGAKLARRGRQLRIAARARSRSWSPRSSTSPSAAGGRSSRARR